MILSLVSNCSDPGMIPIIKIIRETFAMVQIIGPIFAVSALTILMLKLVLDPDDKSEKIRHGIKNSITALILLFLIPTFVDLFMSMAGDSFTVSACWKAAGNYDFSSKSKYIEKNNKNKVKIISEKTYDKGGDGKNSAVFGTGLGPTESISIVYWKKDSKGRCGKGSGDKCAEIATVKYRDKTVKYYMGKQNNSGLLGGSCRAHAFTCGMNATNNSYYSTLDLQNYVKTIDGNGVFKGKKKYNKAIKHFGVNAKAYFDETSIKESYTLAKTALDNGQPVQIFVDHNKCHDLAGVNNHHALLLIGYDKNNNVVFLDSGGLYKHVKKRNLKQLINCMSGDSIAHNWMRMVIFSF